MNEIWSRILTDNSDYYISNQGQVRRTGRTITQGSTIITLPDSILRQGINNDGVYVCFHGKVWYVHTLVANAFVPKPDCKCFVHHKDGDKFNNYANNLEWLPYKGIYRAAGHIDPVKGKQVKCNETGETYPSITNACICLHISYDKLMKHIKHNKALDGLTYSIDIIE